MMKEIGETRNTIVPLDVNDLVSEGHFVTYTGKTVEWFNWNFNEPNNYNNEDYVHMYVINEYFTDSSYIKISKSEGWIDESSRGKWNDIIVFNYYSFDGEVDVFCEYDQ